jgi:hypothetical protein
MLEIVVFFSQFPCFFNFICVLFPVALVLWVLSFQGSVVQLSYCVVPFLSLFFILPQATLFICKLYVMKRD